MKQRFGRLKELAHELIREGSSFCRRCPNWVDKDQDPPFEACSDDCLAKMVILNARQLLEDISRASTVSRRTNQQDWPRKN